MSMSDPDAEIEIKEQADLWPCRMGFLMQTR